MRKLAIKLGGRCNLSCSHCHCRPSAYSFNPDIVDWINTQEFDLIVFEGGEPLLYLDRICKLVSRITMRCKYKIVTNGTLLTDDSVNWLNRNNFQVLVSFDGSGGQRDDTIEPKWELVAKLKDTGLLVCCYHGNMDFGLIAEQVDELRYKYGISKRLPGALHHVSFPHQTEYAPNAEMTDDDVGDYIAQYQMQLAYMIDRLGKGEPIESLWLLSNAIDKWLRPKVYDGFACFNKDNLHLTLDGRFLLCPYDYSYVGDIYSGIDWDKVRSYEPDRCKSCNIRDICKNTCISNVTENECRIAKEMYSFLSHYF